MNSNKRRRRRRWLLVRSCGVGRRGVGLKSGLLVLRDSVTQTSSVGSPLNSVQFRLVPLDPIEALTPDRISKDKRQVLFLVLGVLIDVQKVFGSVWRGDTGSGCAPGYGIGDRLCGCLSQWWGGGWGCVRDNGRCCREGGVGW